jgi:hypothetical protein
MCYDGSDLIQFAGEAQTSQINGGVLLAGGRPVAGASQLGIGNSTAAAGTAACPTTITTNAGATAVAICIVVSVAGTDRYIPLF